MHVHSRVPGGSLWLGFSGLVLDLSSLGLQSSFQLRKLLQSRVSLSIALHIHRNLGITCFALAFIGIAGGIGNIPIFADMLTIAKYVCS